MLTWLTLQKHRYSLCMLNGFTRRSNNWLWCPMRSTSLYKAPVRLQRWNVSIEMCILLICQYQYLPKWQCHWCGEAQPFLQSQTFLCTGTKSDWIFYHTNILQSISYVNNNNVNIWSAHIHKPAKHATIIRMANLLKWHYVLWCYDIRLIR